MRSAPDLWACTVLEDGWLSNCVRTQIIGTAVPVLLMTYVSFYDICLQLQLPVPIIKFVEVLKSPFRNFLHLEDLEEARSRKVKRYPAIWQHRVLVMLAFLEACIRLSFAVYNHSIPSLTEAINELLLALAWFYASIRIIHHSPQRPPYLLLLFYFVQAISASLDMLTTAPEGRVEWDSGFHLIISLLLIYVTGTLPVVETLPGSVVAEVGQVPSSAYSMPEDNVTLWQWCTFTFLEPILKLATRRRLEESDVWALSPYFTHKNLFKKFLEYIDRHPSHTLLRFLLVSNSLDLILDLVLETWSAVVGFVPSYCLQRILAALARTDASSRREAYAFAFLTFIAHLSFAQVDLFKGWHTRRCYERTRGQLFCALHFKALKRRDVSGKASKEAEGESSADLGKIVNLMQGDAYAVAQRFWEFAPVFIAPLRLAIALTFLYKVLGWSSFAGVAVIITAYILNIPLGRYNIWVTRNSWKARDERMRGVNELFQNIRFLKFYGWESLWGHRVREYREEELRWRVKENIVATTVSFIWTWIPSATAIASFLCYTVVAKERLTVSKAFTSIAVFSQLQEPMTTLPEKIFALLHAYVSMQRIDAYLAEGEIEPWASSILRKSVPESQKIGFSEATFSWYGQAAKASNGAGFRLGPLDIGFPHGQLSLVTGATGSGKSALLAALLGEMRCIGGNVYMDKSDHKVAFCAQNPWLEHATIRDNILFGSRGGYNEGRYKAVIDACALQRDLEILEAGDQTEIGEKGVTLSGGQRARVALARAMYSEASCILLDDPLAAVDMHTAQHLVERCLMGELMTGRTVILVTHHISMCLRAAAHIVELSHGNVLRQGSIKELQSKGILQEVIDEEDEPLDKEESETEEEASPVNEADMALLEQASEAKDRKVKGKLIEAEARAEGNVSLATYLTYIRAAGWIAWILTFMFMLSIRFINIASQLFIAKWGEAYEKKSLYLVTTAAKVIQMSPLNDLPPPAEDAWPWLLIFLGISFAGALNVLGYISLGYYASLQASRSLFIAMLARLTRAPSRFFDVTPIGRILNRFTADINTVDSALQQSSRNAINGVLTFAASFLFIVWVIPQFAPFAILIAWLYIRLAPPYVKTARDLRRLESISLSPAFAGFDELLRGLAHVRAFGMEERYQDRFYERVNKFQSFDHVYWLASGWLQWRYDCLGSVVVYVSSLFAILSGVSDGFAAIAIVQAGVFAEASRQLVRVAAQLELDFNSVERIGEYLAAPQEAPAIVASKRPPAWWPSSSGTLVVKDLVVRYAPDLPPALNGLSFTAKPGEKIGVVGRTGSGKTTLAMSLLRIVEPSGGQIILDGVDITKIGLEDLRTRVTIVSQDVSLFTGTVRSNVDPFAQHTDHECWDALQRCHLVDPANAQTSRIKSLDDTITTDGSLSAGERQLVALARAILRRTQVIIMDEATSQIDISLDDQIQKTIREELASALVITIAHRLKTIIDYDRILVLGLGGELLEFDAPHELLAKPGGSFREMCKSSADWDELRGTEVPGIF